MAFPANGSLPQSASLVGRWKLDEASGTRADSVSGNSLTDNNTVLSGTNQFDDTCADFERTNSEYLSHSDNVEFSITGDLSCGGWINLEDNAVTIRFLSKWNATGNQRSYGFRFTSSGNLIFDLSADGSATTAAVYAWTPSTATWYHIAATYDASATTAKIYIDGSPVVTNSSVSASIFDGTADFAIGAESNASNFMDGLMSDWILWDAHLSDSDVSDWYNLDRSGGGINQIFNY